ncbi:MAG: carboxylesterase family protein [Steroidobacteraceae bacterium]
MALDANNWAATTWARLHADSDHGRVFFYYFTHVPPFGGKVAEHGCELTYVFDYPPRKFRYTVQLPLAATADIRLVDTVQTYLTNFAKSGDPNRKGLPPWPEFHRDNPRALQLDTTPAAIPLPDPPGLSVWDAYMAKAREQGMSGTRAAAR